MNELLDRLGRVPDAARQYDDLYEGLVTRVDDSDGIHFTIPEMGVVEYGPGRALQPLYGPAAFEAPGVGTPVLVMFLGGQPGRPVVLGRLPGPTVAAPWQRQPAAERAGS